MNFTEIADLVMAVCERTRQKCSLWNRTKAPTASPTTAFGQNVTERNIQ
jgi:hypothetical protein